MRVWSSGTEEGGGRGGQRVHLKPNIRKRIGKKDLTEESGSCRLWWARGDEVGRRSGERRE